VTGLSVSLCVFVRRFNCRALHRRSAAERLLQSILRSAGIELLDDKGRGRASITYFVSLGGCLPVAMDAVRRCQPDRDPDA
jgi:hypothetical protein